MPRIADTFQWVWIGIMVVAGAVFVQKELRRAIRMARDEKRRFS